MKRIILALALLAALALSAPLHAQDATNEAQPSLPLFADYDLDAVSYTFGWYTGQLGQVLAPPNNNVHLKIKTTGSATAVAAFTTGTNPFAQLSVGDIIYVTTSGATPGGTADGTLGRTLALLITVKTDADNITVSQAVDLSLGYFFTWRKFNTGTTAADGWIPVRGITAGNFVYQIDQQNTTTGIDYKIECKADSPSATAVTIIGPTTKTTTYAGGNVISEPWAFCRFGLKLTSSDDGGDLTTNAEKISVTFEARR